MADNNIPFTALEKKPLETRIYALIKLYQAAERMEFLNDGQKNNEELARISDAAAAFVSSAMEKNASPQAEEVIDNFPELMDLLLAEDSAQRQQIVKEFMNQHSDIAFIATSDWQKTAEGELLPVKMTKTLEEINTIVFEAAPYKKSMYSARELAESISSNSIADDKRQQRLQIVLKNLQQLKKAICTRIAADWKGYKASDMHQLDAFSSQIEQIIGKVDVSYQTKFNTSKSTPYGQPPAPQDFTPKQKALRRIRGYFSLTSGKQYNRDYPTTQIAAKPASKEDFLAVMGTFMQSGYEQYFATGAKPQTADLTALKSKIAKLYPDNAEEALNRILNIKQPQKMSAQQLEKARMEAFSEKAKEIFIKTLCAAISAKRESTKERRVPPEFIKNNFLLYIREMAADGTNDVLQLTTVDANAASWRDVADSKKESYEAKTATVHHHRPIGSTLDLYLMLHKNELSKNETFDTLSELRFLKLADKAEKLANNLGNHCLVFGAGVHESLEANGFYSISDVKDNTVLACAYDTKTIIDEVKMMKLSPIASQSEKIKETLLQDIAKYSRQRDKNGIVRAAIDFPDHPDIEALRQSMSHSKSSNAISDIGSLLTSYVAAIQRRA